MSSIRITKEGRIPDRITIQYCCSNCGCEFEEDKPGYSGNHIFYHMCPTCNSSVCGTPKINDGFDDQDDRYVLKG